MIEKKIIAVYIVTTFFLAGMSILSIGEKEEHTSLGYLQLGDLQSGEIKSDTDSHFHRWQHMEGYSGATQSIEFFERHWMPEYNRWQYTFRVNWMYGAEDGTPVALYGEPITLKCIESDNIAMSVVNEKNFACGYNVQGSGGGDYRNVAEKIVEVTFGIMNDIIPIPLSGATALLNKYGEADITGGEWRTARDLGGENFASGFVDYCFQVPPNEDWSVNLKLTYGYNEMGTYGELHTNVKFSESSSPEPFEITSPDYGDLCISDIHVETSVAQCVDKVEFFAEPDQSLNLLSLIYPDEYFYDQAVDTTGPFSANLDPSFAFWFGDVTANFYDNDGDYLGRDSVYCAKLL